MRDAYQFNELNQMEATWGNTHAIRTRRTARC